MIKNPFDSKLTRITNIISKLCAQKEQLADDLDWFQSTTSSRIKSTLLSLQNEEKRLAVSKEDVCKKIDTYKDEAAALLPPLLPPPPIGTLFDPRNWFNAEQREVRRQQQVEFQHQQEMQQKIIAEAQKIIAEAQKEKRSISQQLALIRKDIKSTKADMARFNSFDPESHTAQLKEISAAITSRKKEARLIEKRKKLIDEKLKPLNSVLCNYDAHIAEAESKKALALDIETRLSQAENVRERAKIRRECGTMFSGEGRPGDIMMKLDGKIGKLQRDRQKVEERAVKIVQRMSHEIQEIVIDGNNLCYEGDQFIGLSALKALVLTLKRDFKISVIFDSPICEMIKLSETAIRREFGPKVTTHIAAHGEKADDTILAFALSRGKNTYVLSNDRFSDFIDNPVVQKDRLLRHNILHGELFVHDLGIHVQFVAKESGG